MSEREYITYHKNSETRTVAVTMRVTSSRKKALADAMETAVRWNLTETRENMIVLFIECEGVRQYVKPNIFTPKAEVQG